MMDTAQQAPPETISKAPSSTYIEYLKNLLRSAWKSFSYDYHDSLQRLRREAENCAALFLLFCIFCFLCAASFTFTEGAYQEELSAKRAVDDLDVGDLILQKETQLVEDLWQAVSALPEAEWRSLALLKVKEFIEESLTLQGCQPLDESEPRDWGILNSFVYMLTVTTSIGYGHIYPSTNAGRALTIVYAILGIPIFLILMADFGKLFTRLLKALFVFVRRVYRTATCRRIRKTKAVQSIKTNTIPPTPPSPTPPLALPESMSGDFDNTQKDDEPGHLRRTHQVRATDTTNEGDGDSDLEEPRPCCLSSCYRTVSGWCGKICGKNAEEEPEEDTVIDDNFNLPISLALFILLLYILIGCFIYTIWEEWSYFTAFYFIFISMTTIGFGDLVPQHPAFMMMTTVYLVFGLALTAMCINIIQEKLTDTFRKASEKLKESLGHIMAAATQGEEGSVQEGKQVEVAEVHGVKKPPADPPAEPPATEKVTVKKET